MQVTNQALHSIGFHGATLLRRHWPIIVLVIVFMGLEYTGQRMTRFIQRYRNGVALKGTYSPLAVRGLPRSVQDEVTYTLVARQTVRSPWEWSTGDSYVYEYRDAPGYTPMLTIGGMGLFMWLVGDPDRAFDAVKVLNAGVVPLVVYIVVVAAASGRLLAPVTTVSVLVLSPLLGTVAPVLADGILDRYSFIVGLTDVSAGLAGQFSRIPFSALTFPWLVASIALFAWALERRTTGAAVIGGVAVGAQLMIYPYYATSWGLGYPILTLWFIGRREWKAVKVMMIAGVVALAVAIPALIHQWRFMHLPQAKEIVAGYGHGTAGWNPQTVTLVATVIVLWGIAMVLRGRWRSTLWVTLALIAGAALCLNLHLVTGVEMQSWHWIDRVVEPLLMLALCLVGGAFIRWYVVGHNLGRRWSVAAAVIATVVVTFAATKAVIGRIALAQELARVQYLPNDHRRAYRWLEENAPRGSVVVSLSTEQLRLLPLFARTYVYIPIEFTVAPYREKVERWVAACRYYGMSPEQFDDLIDGPATKVLYNTLPPEMSDEAPPWWFERTTLHQAMFIRRFRKSTSVAVPYTFPDSVVADFRERFSHIDDPESALRRYRVDYIWQGPYERAVGIDSLEKARNLELAFETGRVRIYRMRPLTR